MENSIEIPINANVFCSDGQCGHSLCVIIDPREERVTHVVVRENHFPHKEILVSTHMIEQANPETIKLKCNKKQLEGMQEFIDEEFVHFIKPAILYQPNSYIAWPIENSEEISKLVKHENIPYGEMVIHKNSHVYATDGRIGQVDDFLVNPENELITHIVMREGHLWGQREIVIPISAIKHIEDDSIYLKINRVSVETLPEVNAS
jgi:sporulation protein YlmC with PRC-barrel domain